MLVSGGDTWECVWNANTFKDVRQRLTAHPLAGGEGPSSRHWKWVHARGREGRGREGRGGEGKGGEGKGGEGKGGGGEERGREGRGRGGAASVAAVLSAQWALMSIWSGVYAGARACCPLVEAHGLLWGCCQVHVCLP